MKYLWMFNMSDLSVGFKSIRVGLNMHGSSFNDTHFVAKQLLKLNNTVNT